VHTIYTELNVYLRFHAGCGYKQAHLLRVHSAPVKATQCAVCKMHQRCHIMYFTKLGWLHCLCCAVVQVTEELHATPTLFQFLTELGCSLVYAVLFCGARDRGAAGCAGSTNLCS
jgi:hypothetical protein